MGTKKPDKKNAARKMWQTFSIKLNSRFFPVVAHLLLPLFYSCAL